MRLVDYGREVVVVHAEYRDSVGLCRISIGSYVINHMYLPI